MDDMIMKGFGMLFIMVFLAAGLLTLGSLGSGAGSFWYYLNNPNTSALNVTSGQALGAGTVSILLVSLWGIYYRSKYAGFYCGKQYHSNHSGYSGDGNPIIGGFKDR